MSRFSPVNYHLLPNCFNDDPDSVRLQERHRGDKEVLSTVASVTATAVVVQSMVHKIVPRELQVSSPPGSADSSLASAIT